MKSEVRKMETKQKKDTCLRAMGNVGHGSNVETKEGDLMEIEEKVEEGARNVGLTTLVGVRVERGSLGATIQRNRTP